MKTTTSNKKNDKVEEFERWDIHQSGCSYRKKGKWIVLPCDMNCKNVFEGRFSQALTSSYEQGVKDTEKAYGGCRKCYGKGYATVKDYTTQYADFHGDSTVTRPNPLMRYCSCERGQQLQEILTTNDR